MPDYIAPPSTLLPGAFVWAYLRDSGGDSQEQSINQQLGEIQTYCKKHGLILDQVFQDEAKSGGSVIHREQFLEMVDFTETPQARPGGILLWNFARFSRDLDDASYYKAILRKRGIVVHSLTDPIPEGTYGRIVETMIDIANEERRRQTSRDVKRSLQSLFRQGYSFGTPPKGYKNEQTTIGIKRNGQERKVSRWIPDPELWELVKLSWGMRAEGRSYDEIREKTHQALFTANTSFFSFFSNKAYLGIGVWGNLEIPNHHEAAIDLSTWEAVQLHMEKTRRPRSGINHPRTMGTPSLLAGLAYCLTCGGAMVKDRVGKNHWDCYICNQKRRTGWKTCDSRYVGAKEAENQILEAVLHRILTPDFILALLEEARVKMSKTVDFEKEQTKLEKTLAETEKNIRNLLDLAEQFGAKAALERLKERESERAYILGALQKNRAKQKAANVEISPEALGMVLLKWQEELSEAGRRGDLRGLKNLLTRFVNKIELGYNQARIHYTFPIEALNGNDLAPCGGTLLLPCRALVVLWE